MEAPISFRLLRADSRRQGWDAWWHGMGPRRCCINYSRLYSKFHDPKRILFISFFFAILLTGVILQQALAKMGKSGLYVALIYVVVAASFCNMGNFVRERVDTKSVGIEQFTLKDVKRETGIGEGERYFAQDIGIQYSYNYTRSNFAWTLLPNLASLYGLEDVQGYNPFIPWRYAVYMRRLNSAPMPSVTLYPSHFGLVRNPDSPWLEYFGEVKARGTSGLLLALLSAYMGLRRGITCRSRWAGR